MPEFEKMVQGWISTATEHGAIFENVEFRSDDRGYSVAAVDPNLECRIFVPKTLLIAIDAFEITDETHRVSQDYPVPDQIRSLFDEILQFVLNNRRIEGLRSFYREFRQLPSDLFEKLEATSCFPLLRFGDETTQQDLKNQLLRARTIRFSEKGRVMMPFLDFMNHHPESKGFVSKGHGIQFSGMASDSGELFASYSDADPIQILNVYAFSGESHFAYSLPIGFETSSGTTVKVGRRQTDYAEVDGLRVPKSEAKGNQVTLSHVLLGSVKTPRRPFWSFAKAWLGAGLKSPHIAYSRILRHNWKYLLDLQRSVADVDGEAAAMLRDTLFNQLSVMAENIIDPSAIE